MNILILGIDGFCGWPTALNLIARNHNITGVDNFIRRKIDLDLNTNSITPIAHIGDRVEVVSDIFNSKINFYNIDVSKNYELLLKIIKINNIDTIIHFAEQKSAPYSMLSSFHRNYTVDKNINATHNVLSAIVESGMDIHLVHLGTMGVYGYKDDMGEIPEGYLDVKVKSTNKDVKILFPTDPGSIYHMTKSLDQILFQFYNKNWGIRITDLHQGIVWGAETQQTKMHESLINRFDYDGEYGTVLNRFIAQSAIGHPLTVYGTGGQERGYIHITDSVDCIRRSVENPPNKDSVRIFNQVAEVASVIDIAKLISNKTNTKIKFISNPRKERLENRLYVKNTGLKSLGWEPKKISDALIDDIILISNNYKHNINSKKIMSTAKW